MSTHYPINLHYDYNAIIKTFNKDIYSFCISNSCKNDFFKYYWDKLDANKMFVTYIATNQQYVQNYDKQELVKILKKYGIEHNLNDKYLFSLCSLEPRKNLPFTITCLVKFIKKHNIQDLYFYLGGGTWNFFESVMEKTIEEAGEFRHKIKLLGYVEDADVNILYSNSLFFTFLSQYEGFGMPPLEAMQAGTPVITSNNSSLPEVVGDAAISLTYNDEEAVIKAFENFYFNEELRKEYITKGLERAKMFSWEKCVGKMIEVIEGICL
jgi:glycosyltransferase involved in cell wall biosynthesis